MIKRILLVIVLTFIGSGSLVAQERLIEKANQKYEEYSFSPAIDIYKKVLEKGFVTADMLKRLGNAYYFKADYSEASKVYKRLVDEFPTDLAPEYYFRYAQVLKSLGNYSESDAVMSKFTQMTSGDERALAYKNERNYLEEIKDNY